MKVLVLGSDGALGHVVFDYLTEYGYDTYGTVRKSKSDNPNIYPNIGININNGEIESIHKIIKFISPEVIINCIGLVKQRDEDFDNMFLINSFFPMQLKKEYEGSKKLIHISSDCVFDGKIGNYKETWNWRWRDPDCMEHDYGVSKGLGEIEGNEIITLRTSFIGPEKNSHLGLFDWFLSQTDTVKGFKNAYFSGITSLELAKVIHKTIEKMDSDNISGIYHVGAEKISKYDLLVKIKDCFKTLTEIIPDESFVIDRSLDSSKFNEAFNYNCPDWDTMLEELKEWMDK